MSSFLRDFHVFVYLCTEQKHLAAAAAAAAAETPKLTVVKVCRVQHLLICCPNARGSDREWVETDKKNPKTTQHKIIHIEKTNVSSPF